MQIAGLINPFRPAEGTPPRSLWAFLRWALEGSWPVVLLASGVSAIAGVFEVLSALVLGHVIDTALAHDPAVFFARNWLLLAGFAVFFILLRPIASSAMAAMNSIVIAPNLMPLVLSRLHRFTLGQAVTFFDNDFAGRIAQKQMQTARAVTDVISESVNVISFSLASLIGSALFLVSINIWIAVALTFWLAAYFLLIKAFLPRVRRTSMARAGARAMVTGQVVDTITNIKTVKLFANAEHEDGAALDTMQTYRDRTVDFGVVSAWFRLALMVLAGLLPVVLVGGTLVLWTRGAASPGDIAAAGAIALRIAQMTGWVSFVLMAIYANVGEIEDGIRTLTPPHSLPDSPDARPLPKATGTITFKAVSFAYGRREGGIDAVSLTIPAGEKIGIVGASGAGKSTLIALLLRLYDPEQGRILIDGHDLRDVTQASLRRQIATVTQETALFNRSARDNILYGRPGASMDDVIAAARQAEAHGFIKGMKDHFGRSGYDAHLGERGVKLSGGQRQRIALARAFLKDAPILVLDEATSALDSEVEASIQTALIRVMQGKTVLAIAHRLSTIAAMDRIIVMDHGRIIETGRHDELLAQNGLYARYWNRQSGGFIGVADAAE
ncbi:MAG: ABC transporter ATP-binding protein [Rhodobacteraceae bacterium]|nr:ABC transporter ATP-binding protein [Paracoccaceae bacterium]